jgi:uncharacterized membrane protein YphA (DoxX/SURF4 family)
MFREIDLVLQLTIGVVFLLSAIGKLRDPSGFAQGLAEYELVPRRLSYSAALILTASEALLALSHLTGWMLQLAAPLGICLLVCFALAVGANLRRGRILPCYCFGGRGKEYISGATLARLIMLISAEASLTALINSSVRPKLQALHIREARELGFTLLWVAVLFIVATWSLSIRTLWSLLSFRVRQDFKSSLEHGQGS